jgi:uncharacterized membrane protein YfcA
MLVQALLLALAGFAAGAVNAVAGGGSLIVFPALLATGLAPLPATVTNSVTQGPGFLGATLSQLQDLRGQPTRLLGTSIATVFGTSVGCALLLLLPGKVFDAVVPALMIIAALLMAFQQRIKGWLSRDNSDDRKGLMLVGTFLVSIYGGYFGGARSIVLIALLMLTSSEAVRRLNALKNWLALVDSAVTLVVFAVLAPVHWLAVLVLTPTTVAGGYAGGRLSRHLPATALRYLVVLFALAVAIWMIVRGTS